MKSAFGLYILIMVTDIVVILFRLIGFAFLNKK